MMISTPETLGALIAGSIPSYSVFHFSSSSPAWVHMLDQPNSNPASTISAAAAGPLCGMVDNASTPQERIANALSANLQLQTIKWDDIKAHAAKMRRKEQERCEEAEVQRSEKSGLAAKAGEKKPAWGAQQDNIAGWMIKKSLADRAAAQRGEKTDCSAERDAVKSGALEDIIATLFKGGEKPLTDALSGAVASMKDVGVVSLEHSAPQVAEAALPKSELAISMLGDTGVKFSEGFLPSPSQIGFARSDNYSKGFSLAA